jgi:hypothetical protein
MKKNIINKIKNTLVTGTKSTLSLCILGALLFGGTVSGQNASDASPVGITDLDSIGSLGNFGRTRGCSTLFGNSNYNSLTQKQTIDLSQTYNQAEDYNLLN